MGISLFKLEDYVGDKDGGQANVLLDGGYVCKCIYNIRKKA